MRVLSVDLGTSNTVAVLSAHGRPPRVIEVDGSATMPSAVFATDDGTLIVGRDAERRARLDPARFEPNPKRRVDESTLLLGNALVSVTDALAAVLHEIALEAARQLGGSLAENGDLDVDEVRLTHPAGWNTMRRTTLLAAARLAGLGPNLVLIPEPVAAAAHFATFPGHTLDPGQALAIYDLGAGTFDCTVVAATEQGFAVLAEDGLPDLGGLDVDQALLEHVGREVSHHDPAHWQRLLRPESTGDRRAQHALRDDVRAAKEELSRHLRTEVPMPEPFDDVLVTRAELEALIKPSLLRSVELLASTIASTGLSPSGLRAIYLVGGSSRIPLVATLIADRLGVVPTSLDQPETAVALGAVDVPADGVGIRPTEVVPQPPRSGQQPGHEDNGGQTATMPGHPVTGPQPTLAHPNPRPYDTRPYQDISAYEALSAYQSSSARSEGSAHPGGSGYPAGSVRSEGSFREGGPAYPGGFAHPGGSGYGGGSVHPNTPAPGVPTQFRAGTPGRRRTRYLLIGVAAVVVVALLVVGGIFWLRGSGRTTDIAATCRQASGGPDAQGFTRCLRQLAGTLPDHSRCRSGAGVAGTALSSADTAVTCVLATGEAGYTVTYLQGNGADLVAGTLLARLLSSSDGERVEAQWQGNGLRGRYEAGTSADLGVLVFTVDDSPLLGVLTKDRSGDGSALSAGDLADYFERDVQPGT